MSDWSSDVCSSDRINGRVEDPFGRVDVVVEIAGRTVFGHASVAQGGADEFPVVLLVCIGPDELGTGHLVGEQSLCLAAGDAVEADITQCFEQIGRASCRESMCQYG